MIKIAKLKIISLSLLIFILAVFLYLKIVPFGKISYVRDYSQAWHSGKGFIYGFTPAERIESTAGNLPRLIGDPIYFSLFTPRTFDKAKITVIYRDHLSTSTPLVEAGVLVDKLVWRYDLKPLQNNILDKLMFIWPRLEENGVMFLQKEKNYSSLIDFKKDLETGNLKNCSGGPASCVAIYNYPLKLNYHLVDYQNSEAVVLANPLRGAHQFYLYLNNGPLRLAFDFVDLNQDKELDPITVTLYSGDKVIVSKQLLDENPAPASGQLEEKSLTLEPANLSAGAYKVEVKISDDVVIKKIVSSVSRLSFINKVWPVSSGGQLSLYTDADYLQVKALNPASLQTINFSGQNFSLDKAYDQFIFKTSSKAVAKEIRLSKDDVILENSGVFAWSPAGLFNPSLKKVDRFFLAGETSYIIAGYEPPQETDDGFKIATAEFNLRGAYRENGKYSFMLSIPGLKVDNGSAEYLEIKEIRIDLNGRTLWQKIGD